MTLKYSDIWSGKFDSTSSSEIEEKIVNIRDYL